MCLVSHLLIYVLVFSQFTLFYALDNELKPAMPSGGFSTGLPPPGDAGLNSSYAPQSLGGMMGGGVYA